MLYELHITVDPETDPIAWNQFCAGHDAKPLRIELEGGNPSDPVQIMFAAVFEGSDDQAYWWVEALKKDAVKWGFDILRVKLEVPLDKSKDYKEPVYHECHVKSLIPGNLVEEVVTAARDQGWVASRNGYFTHDDGLEKWYFTKRDYTQDYLGAGRYFREEFAKLPTAGFNTLRMESETVIFDSNEELDSGWAVR